jgi:hypothetical protein
MAKGGRRQGAGRPKGSPNKATADVRAAMALLAERNVEKLDGWLRRTAKKDPAKAADLFLRAIEYHIPKLARTELTGKDGETLQVNILDPTRRDGPT